mgnify:CR=1 FL=1
MTDDWRTQARCRGLGPNLFFSDKGEAQTQATAMMICHGAQFTNSDTTGLELTDTGQPCPVRHDCLEYALRFDSDEDYGIFGGTTPSERRLIRRERNKNTSRDGTARVTLCRRCRGTGLRASKSGQVSACSCRDGLTIRYEAFAQPVNDPTRTY